MSGWSNIFMIVYKSKFPNNIVLLSLKSFFIFANSADHDEVQRQLNVF